MFTIRFHGRPDGPSRRLLPTLPRVRGLVGRGLPAGKSVGARAARVCAA
jgi:hypothetical protein